jgi:uncharacterized protein (TIGR03086 family)
MNSIQSSSPGWTGELNELIVHGRDREATELATRHLTGMGPLQQLDELEPLLGKVASGITAAHLDAPTPCANFAVRGVLGHMIDGATQFAAAFRGETAPAVPADISDGPDVVARAGSALADPMAAMRSPGALDRSIASPFGAMPGEEFARFVVLDGLVHGWDLATATHQTYEPTETLVAAADAFARKTIAAGMRDDDTFAQEVDPATGATPIERLVAFTGRRP